MPSLTTARIRELTIENIDVFPSMMEAVLEQDKKVVGKWRKGASKLMGTEDGKQAIEKAIKKGWLVVLDPHFTGNPLIKGMLVCTRAGQAAYKREKPIKPTATATVTIWDTESE